VPSVREEVARYQHAAWKGGAIDRAKRADEDLRGPDEVADIVQRAVESRNGWKVILARCAPIPLVKRASPGAEAQA
jgi:hypothetical protein